MTWVITNKVFKNYLNVEKIANSIFFYSENLQIRYFSSERKKKTGIFIDGYVLLRNKSKRKYYVYKNEELIFKLYLDYGLDFINYIKGNFTLFLIISDEIRLFSDHLGLKKCFYSFDEKNIIISNDINVIMKNVSVEIERNSIIDHVLFNHFINERTIYKNVFFNKPGQYVTIKKDIISVNHYWNYFDLIQNNAEYKNYHEIADLFLDTIKSYNEIIKPKNLSSAITGGVDCRLIISTLLNLGFRPNVYTYGNPESADCVYGRKAAEKLNLNWKNYSFVDVQTVYPLLMNEILEKGNTLASIHRAHRLYAIKKEDERSDLMFFGYLGSEMIRGLWPDDLIISEFVRKLWEKPKDINGLIKNIFLENHFLYNKNDIDYAIEVSKLFNSKNDYYSLKYLTEVIAHIHFAQDLNLFEYYLTTIPLFMDIDIMNVILSSDISSLKQSRMVKNDIFRSNVHEFYANLIYELYKPMAYLKLSKGFKLSDYKKNKSLVLIQKYIHDHVNREKFPPNFSYNGWFREIIAEKLDGLENYRDYFNFDRIPELYNEKDCFPFSRMLEVDYYIEKSKSG
ncbi:MAG: hypothetical protein JXA99_17135 [Candidatus Lokiarchaeota archaeon]|nr:hypothetical protein [Candidatus Lokiarchaeota archaeon]